MPAKVKEIRRNKLMREVRELWTKHQNASESDKAALRIKYEAMLDEVADIDERRLHDELENTGQAVNDDPQFQELTQRGSISDVVAAVLENRETNGETRELQSEMNLSSNQIPLAMLTEHRAVTPAPANTARNQGEIIPAVFPRSAAAFLSVMMPTVPVGDRVYPVITKNAEVKSPAAAGTAGETTGAFAASNLEPKRLQASFFYNREDRASFIGMDMALRQNLSDALSDALDAKVIAGLISGGTALDKKTSLATYKNFVTDMCYGAVDGRYAATAQDIRIVMGSETYGLAANTFANSTTTLAPTALDRLIAASGGVQVGANVPAAASSLQKSIVRRGMAMDAVAPVWEGVTLINDEITKAATGQIVLTAVMMYDFAVLRKDAFVIPQLKVA